jgi:hypothetical protein
MAPTLVDQPFLLLLLLLLLFRAVFFLQFGFIPWFSSSVVDIVSGLGLTWQPAFGIILVLYFYSHYFFASGAAHIGAMYTAFLAVARACGTPAMLAALALGQVRGWAPGGGRGVLWTGWVLLQPFRAGLQCCTWRDTYLVAACACDSPAMLAALGQASGWAGLGAPGGGEWGGGGGGGGVVLQRIDG